MSKLKQMEKYKKTMKELLTDKKFIVPVILTAILAFGYLFAHSTVNIDTLSADRYFAGIELIGQSRLFAPLLEKIFNIMDFYPFFVDFISVILLIIAGTAFCALFHEVSNGKINRKLYTVFTCFFISYPLIIEIFNYVPMGICIALGFMFVALALSSYKEFLVTNQKRYIGLAVLLMWGAISLYEVLAVVYIIGAFIIQAIELLYVNPKKKFKDIFKDLLICSVPLLIAIIINFVVAFLFKLIFKIPNNTKSAKEIVYSNMPILIQIQYLFHTILVSYVFNGLSYLPITYLVITVVLSCVIAVIKAVKNKNFSVILVFLGMQISLILLALLQGSATFYRMCQQFQLFVPFVIMITMQIIIDLKKKDLFKKLSFVIIGIMLFYQIKDLYHWEYLNNIRYEKEVSDMRLVANELISKYDINKPLIFIGTYKMPKSIIDEITIRPNSLHEKVVNWYSSKVDFPIKFNGEYQITAVQSYVKFAELAHIKEYIPGIELIKFFKYLGYDDFKTGDIMMLGEALEDDQEEPLPIWPREGSIKETEKYIIIKLGPNAKNDQVD